MMKKKVAIIILNFNGFEHTIECVESVRKINYPHYGIIICDNNSDDDSLKRIINFYKLIEIGSDSLEYRILKSINNKSEITENANRQYITPHVKNIFYSREEGKNSSENIVLIAISRNLGFGGGNNIGIMYGLEKNFNYILLLNNDT
ncbi:MAG: glycosyltransferase, partial [Thermodesulfobacteriota bacterium]|nr:glycosyltransferase [Thermodesulfobacteriota bacterium]